MTDALLRAALQEVFLRHRDIDFDWYGWSGRARQALASPPVVTTDEPMASSLTWPKETK